MFEQNLSQNEKQTLLVKRKRNISLKKVLFFTVIALVIGCALFVYYQADSKFETPKPEHQLQLESYAFHSKCKKCCIAEGKTKFLALTDCIEECQRDGKCMPNAKPDSHTPTKAQLDHMECESCCVSEAQSAFESISLYRDCILKLDTSHCWSIVNGMDHATITSYASDKTQPLAYSGHSQLADECSVCCTWQHKNDKTEFEQLEKKVEACETNCEGKVDSVCTKAVDQHGGYTGTGGHLSHTPAMEVCQIMTPITTTTRLLTLKCTRTDDIKHKIFYKKVPVGLKEINEIKVQGYFKCGRICVAAGSGVKGQLVERGCNCALCCSMKFGWWKWRKALTCTAECFQLPSKGPCESFSISM